MPNSVYARRKKKRGGLKSVQCPVGAGEGEPKGKGGKKTANEKEEGRDLRPGRGRKRRMMRKEKEGALCRGH